jgi:hypothetical protein
MRRGATVALMLSALLGLPAHAQEAEPEVEVEPTPAPAPPPISTDDEGPIPEPDVPEDPLAGLPPEAEVEEEAPRYLKRDYPIELVRRPLTLAADQVEVSLDVPLVLNDGNPLLTQILRGGFGVTIDLELGLTYAVGLERLSAEPGEDGFEPGRAFSVDAAYTLLPGYLAVQARVAFFIDPEVFGVGLILGLPYKIEIGDRWAIFGGADLVRLRLKEFAVDPADPAASSFYVGEIARGVEPGIGSGRLLTGAMFQARPDLALDATFAIARDFDTDVQTYGLSAGATFSPTRTIDLGARVGAGSLDDAAETFAVAVHAALRI